jgi:hypothetical protein
MKRGGFFSGLVSPRMISRSPRATWECRAFTPSTLSCRGRRNCKQDGDSHDWSVRWRLGARLTHTRKLSRRRGGLSVDDTAEVLEISSETVTRDWKFARVWLERELGSERPD